MTKRMALEGKRRWFKLYPHECLYGSIRYQLNSAERGVWYDLLCFANQCTQPGLISDSDLRPVPHEFLANRLNITLELLENALKLCKTEGRITEDAAGIHISNWKFYQGEYDRVKEYQKNYREKKKTEV